MRTGWPEGLSARRLRMHIDDRQVAFAVGPAPIVGKQIHGYWEFRQGEVFRRRAQEDQVIIFDVVEREQAAALYPNLPVQRAEDLV